MTCSAQIHRPPNIMMNDLPASMATGTSTNTLQQDWYYVPRYQQEHHQTPSCPYTGICKSSHPHGNPQPLSRSILLTTHSNIVPSEVEEQLILVQRGYYNNPVLAYFSTSHLHILIQTRISISQLWTIVRWLDYCITTGLYYSCSTILTLLC